MPTGYTCDIKNGISLETYALNCARAFGACVTLRDEPGGGGRIPDEFKPSDYHVKAGQTAKDELAALAAMSKVDRDRAADLAWKESESARLRRLQSMRETKDAYEAMLAKVRAWQPPTPDHQGLHEFMQKQIEESIAFDCGEDYYSKPTPRLDGAQWAAEKMAQLKRDIAYHKAEYAAEVKSAAERTAWVRALRDSLTKIR